MIAPRRGKRIPDQSVIGQQGVTLVAQRVLSMGFLWHPTVGSFDAGIDGYIELRDRETGEALNGILQVQSKATTGKFTAETATGFAYVCDERDLAYWLQGNAPVILILSRPGANEAYWVAVKEYFSDPARRRSRKIVFDKTRNRFDDSARDALVALAIPRGAGVYFAPPPRHETLYSNLLEVVSIPDTLYVGQALITSRHEFGRRAREAGVGIEWRQGGGQVVSIYDLADTAWGELVDRGTVEPIPATEWADADDARRREFVELLNRCLSARARQLGLHRSRDEEYYYFPATTDLSPRKISYASLRRGADRTVFQRYATKKAEQAAREYYRHSAFLGQFRRYDDAWYLEITPTYHFTYDGHRPLRFPGSKRKGIKALEKNPTVLGQVVMWADLLRDERDGLTLFPSPTYPHLTFGELAAFEVDVGINDDAWLAGAETGDAGTTA
ncbi:MAG TPA: DUF4365 domain-containing protein, partial [Gemmatimonadales bacterium]|nr:DUF4365 domain-containing protein [Gemmatimonadales bacterium]